MLRRPEGLAVLGFTFWTAGGGAADAAHQP